MERRLAAVFAADVVGYSKLMAADEVGTLAALREHRRTIFDPEIAKRGGRIVKLMGDGTLVEFPSIVDAVEAALAIQKTLSNGDSLIRLRIGIHLGDVIIDGDDIYGDGVNVAARLEALAEPDGICVSSIVHESLGNRIDAQFADAGMHEVKNIVRPIRIFSWPSAIADTPRMELVPAEVRRDTTISVLPLENLSDDPELGYFCEGVTQDIVTAFGNIEQLTVVADEHRADQGKARFSLTGNVRKAGSRMRASAQLVDRHTGVQLWADRFDRDVSNLFEVQDDVTRNIVIAIHTELGAGSYTNRWQWGTSNFEAWQLMAKGFHEFQKFSPSSFAKTASMWEKALKIDPEYLAPLMGCGYVYSHLALIAEPAEAEDYLARAEAIFEKSSIQVPTDVRPYAAKRGVAVARGDYDTAVTAAQTALDMEPDDSYCRATLSGALLCADRIDEALAQATTAAQDIRDPPGWFHMIRILCDYRQDRLAVALDRGRELVANIPDFYPGPPLTAAIAMELGCTEEAAMMRRKSLEIDPQFSANQFIRWIWLTNPDYRTRLHGSLLAAGMPE